MFVCFCCFEIINDFCLFVFVLMVNFVLFVCLFVFVVLF